MDASDRRILASLRRSLATVRRSIAIVTRVVAQNRNLKDDPRHEGSAVQRINEGQQELTTLESQQGGLERRIEDLERRA